VIYKGNDNYYLEATSDNSSLPALEYMASLRCMESECFR